jgi:heme exporter protein D
MNLGPHAAFILSAYVVAIAIVAGLATWVVLDRRQLTRMLDSLEAQGLSRRSGRPNQDTGRSLERG